MLNGWFNIDKVIGCTSSQVVSKLRKILNIQSIGHAGTLDPLATGVLPIAVGQATKTSIYIMNCDKEYEFEITFGAKKDTDDNEGNIIEVSDYMPSKDEISRIIPKFIGPIDQIPPIYSAIKIDGKRAYKLARENKVVNLIARKVMIHNIEMLSYNYDKKIASFFLSCGKGTYVRSIARDMAEQLGTYGYVSSLRRKKVGLFTEDTIISLANLEKLVHNNQHHMRMVSMIEILGDIPGLIVSRNDVAFIKHGRSINIDYNLNDSLYKVVFENELIAIGEVKGGLFKPRRVFNID